METLSIKPGAFDGHFILSGRINEFLQFASIQECGHAQITLNLKGIKGVNSVGLKKWIQELKNLHSKKKQVVYEECSEPFIQVCGMSNSMTAGVTVKSFEVTLCCENCDELVPTMIQRDELDEDNSIPENPCPHCNTPMALEEDDALDFLIDHAR